MSRRGSPRVLICLLTSAILNERPVVVLRPSVARDVIMALGRFDLVAHLPPDIMSRSRLPKIIQPQHHILLSTNGPPLPDSAVTHVAAAPSLEYSKTPSVPATLPHQNPIWVSAASSIPTNMRLTLPVQFSNDATGSAPKPATSSETLDSTLESSNRNAAPSSLQSSPPLEHTTLHGAGSHQLVGSAGNKETRHVALAAASANADASVVGHAVNPSASASLPVSASRKRKRTSRPS